MKAKSDFSSAEREYRRQQDLYTAHAGSQKDLETAEGNYRKAKAEHDRAQLKSTMLKSGSLDEVTQQYTLRSRIAGEIIARNVNPGAEVQGQYSGANNPIEMFTIGELDPIWVFADVYEMDLSRIQPGAPVAVRSPLFPDEVFRGKVDWIADTLDPVLRTAKVRCSLANPKRRLKPDVSNRHDISASQVAAGSSTIRRAAPGRRDSDLRRRGAAPGWEGGFQTPPRGGQ